jgi:hypothetical protein
MADTRTEEYSRIRMGLDRPYAQQPSPHMILDALLKAEQTLNLRLVNSRQPWNQTSEVITTVAGTSTYEITKNGKLAYVVRATGVEEAPFLPIAFDDATDQDYGKLPSTHSPSMPFFIPAIEKVTVYWSNLQDQTRNLAINPTPQESGIEYTLWFRSGRLDRSTAAMDSTGILPELSDYKVLKAQLHLLAYCQWSDSPQADEAKRQRLGLSIGAQLAELEPVVDEYIRSINVPKGFDMEYALD